MSSMVIYSNNLITYIDYIVVEAGFPTLTGMISLAFFTHNGVLSVLRCQKHPENNVRCTI